MVVFLWPIVLFDFRWYKKCTTHFGIKKLCTLWNLALAKRSCNVINKSARKFPATSGAKPLVNWYCSVYDFTTNRVMVMLKIIFLALLFSVRLRFPVDKSIAYILRSRYGNTVVKDIRKFEKMDFTLRKCKLDMMFLEACLENQAIPEFLDFRVSNFTCLSCLST